MTRSTSIQHRVGTCAVLALLSAETMACAANAASVPHAPPSTETPRTVHGYLPFEHDSVLSYETRDELTGETGQFNIHVLRRATDTIELRVGSRVEFLETSETGIGYAAGGYLLRAPLVPGASFRGEFGSVSITAVDRSIAVPAGSFADCIETCEELTRNGVLQRATRVFCLGVGMVSLITELESNGESRAVHSRLRSHGPAVSIDEL
jgi:hypothetical protein